MRIDVKALALTFGILWSLGLFLMTWWLIALGEATGAPTFIGHFYRGYSVTPVGSLIGLVWAFFDGLVGGAIFAWTYNWLAGRKQDRVSD